MTTLLDAASSRVADLAELYRQRGPVEPSRVPLPTPLQREVLHGHTVPGVLQELSLFALVYTRVRLGMGPSANLPHLGVAHISCLEALRWLGAPSRGLPVGALSSISIRPDRVEPRVKKRRPKNCPCMITSRQARRQQLVPQEPRG